MNAPVTMVATQRDDVDPRQLRNTGLHPDFWYPVARSRDLKRKQVVGVSFAGQPIALARTESGAIMALENRCAHRQVPLDTGAVSGEHLQCGYHCWTYDRTGRCVNVPHAMGDNGRMPTGIKSYACREAYGLIFIFPGDQALADSVAFPDIPSAGNPAYKTRYLDRRVNCHYSFMHENLMDMYHQFLHRRLMGGIKTLFLDMREGDAWIEVDYSFVRAKGAQPIGEKFILGKRPAPTTERDRDMMTIRTEYPYQTLRFWTAGSTEPALDLWNVYIPVDAEQRVNHTFGLMMIRRPGIPGLIHLLWPFIIWFTEGIFAEDRWIVELEQDAFDKQGEDLNQEVFPVIRGLKRVLTRNGLPLRGNAPAA
ncbi:MAG: Rieske 2Fe-2S domain-containing protein [Gammaproteobacteria bacterium]|nr:Rieske 2Fe-2S domain-containing protein [Gammaproteobacteria bacterium]